MFRRLGPLAVVVLLSVRLSVSQIATGTISGTVRDSSGAVLPGSTISLTNVETSSTRTVSSDARGYYAAPNLTLGQYEVTAGSQGFQTSVRRGIMLNVGQNAVIDFALQVGSVSERVEVSADAPLVETTTATVSGLVNERQVQDLPLNARDLVSLGTLYTGVVAPTTGERSASKGFGTKLSISGTRYTQNLFQLDGADINDAANSAGGAAGILMGAETIREFNVITNGYSAEYGRHTGGVFNAVTKSGTNSLHGSAFEFLRNDALDSPNYFDVDPTTGKQGDPPPYKRNQFGFSLGGPIARDRTFFFGSYEGLRERQSDTNTYTVPSLSARQRAAAPGVRPYLDSYPIPKGPDRSADTADWVDARTVPTTENFFTTRVDQKLADKDSLFGRYSFDDASLIERTGMNVYSTNDSRNQYATLGETHIFSQAVINQLLLSYTRTVSAQANQPIEGLVFPTVNFTTHAGAVGSLTVTGLSGWGGDSTFPRASILNMFQIKNDVFWTAGSNSIKFGANIQRFRFKYGALFNGGGTFAFSNFANFLSGTVNSFQALTEASQGGAYPEQTVVAVYFQDDVRLSQRLTLNLGVRYEASSVPKEVYGRVSNLPEFLGVNLTPANLIVGNPAYLNPSLKNWAPRLGIVWDPWGDGKTSIRAGGGIFHDQITAGPFLFSYHSSLPFVTVGNIATGAQFPNAFFIQQQQMTGAPNVEGFQYKMKQPVAFKYSADIQREVLPNTSLTLGVSATRGVHLLRVLSMNARLATERDGRLYVNSAANFRSPAFGRLRPRYSDGTSNYYALRLGVSRRYSKGLQLQVSYTFSKTTDDGSNWTGSSDWSNSLGQGARYMNIKEKSLAAFDVRNVLSSSFTYDLPGAGLSGIKKKVLGGWQVSGILALQDGVPFTLSTGVRPGFFQNGFIGDLPDVVADAKFKYHERVTSGGPDGYFDPTPFRLPPGYVAGTGDVAIGNVARTNLIAPGQAKLDFVLVKSTSIKERLNIQFRTEFFNLLNRANFGLPNGRVFASSAATQPIADNRYFADVGRITATTTSSRQIQLGLRLQF